MLCKVNDDRLTEIADMLRALLGTNGRIEVTFNPREFSFCLARIEEVFTIPLLTPYMELGYGLSESIDMVTDADIEATPSDDLARQKQIVSAFCDTSQLISDIKTAAAATVEQAQEKGRLMNELCGLPIKWASFYEY